MTLDAAVVLAGLLSTAALVGVVWSFIRVADALRQIAALQATLLSPAERAAAVELIPPYRRDEYAPDAVMDHMEDTEWLHNFQPPDSWRQ